MYSPWQLALKYCRHYLSSSNGKGHGTHSPFIFHFITSILNDRQHYPDYTEVEKLREEQLNDETVLTIEDMGAGSSMGRSTRRSISSIAKNSAKPKKFGQLLYRMVKEYQPPTILELGTSLGITTSYLSLGNPAARIITLEGATEVAAVATRNFRRLGIENVGIEEGNFDEVLSSVIRGLLSVDLAFIDGNHRQEPTLRYFLQLLPKTTQDSVLIFDDIHWSAEMEQAWKTIREHPETRCSVDLFHIGIVFFRQEFREKQHFSIRF
ncbi:MAG: class I SAM-dependent methyltransferase [Chitinophagaceae bacterium]